MHWPAKIKAGKAISSITRSLDFLPTLCALAGVEADATRKIDGVDRSDLLLEGTDRNQVDEFFYFQGNALNAVRSGDWKLHVHRGWFGRGEPGTQVKELYNLKTDIAETQNRYEQEPEIVVRLMAKIEAQRKELGDRVTNTPATEARPVGRVDNPVPLTQYREDHPYMIAMYDQADMPTMCG